MSIADRLVQVLREADELLRRWVNPGVSAMFDIDPYNKWKTAEQDRDLAVARQALSRIEEARDIWQQLQMQHPAVRQDAARRTKVPVVDPSSPSYQLSQWDLSTHSVDTALYRLQTAIQQGPLPNPYPEVGKEGAFFKAVESQKRGDADEAAARFAALRKELHRDDPVGKAAAVRYRTVLPDTTIEVQRRATSEQQALQPFRTKVRTGTAPETIPVQVQDTARTAIVQPYQPAPQRLSAPSGESRQFIPGVPNWATVFAAVVVGYLIAR